MRIQFDSLWMRIETGLQRASCERPFIAFVLKEPDCPEIVVLMHPNPNNTVSQSMLTEAKKILLTVLGFAPNGRVST